MRALKPSAGAGGREGHACEHEGSPGARREGDLYVKRRDRFPCLL